MNNHWSIFSILTSNLFSSDTLYSHYLLTKMITKKKEQICFPIFSHFGKSRHQFFFIKKHIDLDSKVCNIWFQFERMKVYFYEASNGYKSIEGTAYLCSYRALTLIEPVASVVWGKALLVLLTSIEISEATKTLPCNLENRAQFPIKFILHISK